MKTNFKKIAVIFGVVVLMLAALSVAAFAEKADFTPPADFTDITPANGWVQIASKSAAADDDGKDIELYQLNGADAYLNKNTKTLAIVGKTSLTAGYGDWTVKANLNAPGFKYHMSYWASQNSSLVETIEIRNANAFNNGGYVLSQFKHVKAIKMAPSVNGSNGTKDDTAAFTGLTSLTTVGHGEFDKDGKFTPITYKEGVADLTGFTYLRPQGGRYASKAVMYLGSLFYGCASITEVILPAKLEYTGSYTPAVNNGSNSWAEGPAAIEAKDDEFGGNYAGVLAKNMFSGAEILNKVTIPEGVNVKLIEKNAFAGCTSLRCITIKGTIDPALMIEAGAFTGVGNGCIIQCSSEADIKTLNDIFAANEITNVKAVDMSVEPTPAPKVTKLPVAPAFEEFDSTGATAYGGLKSTYSDNYWAYYQDTKTLKIFAKQSKSYNETGSLGAAEDGAAWSAYKTEIEHVVIGPKIHKLVADCFSGMTALKDIEMTTDIHQAAGKFTENPSLTTIFVTGMEKVEGQAMLAGAKTTTNFKLNFSETAVKSIHMGSSPVPFQGNITPGPRTSTIVFDAPSDAVLAYAEENYLNIANSSGEMICEYYVEVPEGLPFCGDTAVYDFDAATGTLSILGKGAVGDTANYWGGGSKNQFWFDIKKDIKHVIVGDYITTIGKYAFTECENLETVQLPAKDGFVILNAAFEDCYNLKSVYVKGSQPIEGTADLSTIHEFESYTFADNYMLANVVINENVSKIGSSVFDNCVNLQNIYGVPGSFAEEYATKNEFTFFDKAANTPQPIKCEPPAESTTPADTTTPVEDTDDTTAPVDDTSSPADDTTAAPAPETQPVSGGTDNVEDEGTNILPIIIVICAVVVVAIVVVVIIIAKKKAPKAEKKD